MPANNNDSHVSQHQIAINSVMTKSVPTIALLCRATQFGRAEELIAVTLVGKRKL